MTAIVSVKASVVRYVDDDQPGFVECILVDAAGVEHAFVEKVTVVTLENLGLDSEYPRPVEFDCEIVEEWMDEGGQALVRVSTELPWHLESVAGVSVFVVRADQVRKRV